MCVHCVGINTKEKRVRGCHRKRSRRLMMRIRYKGYGKKCCPLISSYVMSCQVSTLFTCNFVDTFSSTSLVSSPLLPLSLSLSLSPRVWGSCKPLLLKPWGALEFGRNEFWVCDCDCTRDCFSGCEWKELLDPESFA